MEHATCINSSFYKSMMEKNPNRIETILYIDQAHVSYISQVVEFKVESHNTSLVFHDYGHVC